MSAPSPVDPSPVDPSPVDPSPVDPFPVAPDADDIADNALLAGLRDRAATRNRERVAQLAGWCDEWELRNRLSEDDLARTRAVIHALIGSAGTFGHPEVSTLARRLGALFASDASSAAPTTDRVAELRVVLSRITAQLGQAGST